MNDEESFALEELEKDIETLKQFLNEEKPKAADLEELAPAEVTEEVEEPAPAPVPVTEAPKPKAKSKPKAPKSKVKEVEEVEKVEVATAATTPSPIRLYGTARLRAKRGR